MNPQVGFWARGVAGFPAGVHVSKRGARHVFAAIALATAVCCSFAAPALADPDGNELFLGATYRFDFNWRLSAKVHYAVYAGALDEYAAVADPEGAVRALESLYGTPGAQPYTMAYSGDGPQPYATPDAYTPIWWASTELAHFEESISPQLLNGTVAAFRAGVVQPLPDDVTLELGVGYLRADFDATSGQTVAVNALQIAGRASYAYDPLGRVFATLGYGHEMFDNRWATDSDEFALDRLTVGLGVEQGFVLADDLIFEAALEYQQAFSHRNGSTTTNGRVIAADDCAIGLATATGRLTKPMDNVTLFAEAELGLITNSNNWVSLMHAPVGGMIGAGADIALSANTDLGVEGFYGFGYGGLHQYGAKVGFTGRW